MPFPLYYRYTTDLKSGDTIWTDNGLEMRQVRPFHSLEYDLNLNCSSLFHFPSNEQRSIIRDTKPEASYYPVQSTVLLRDKAQNTQLTVSS